MADSGDSELSKVIVDQMARKLAKLKPAKKSAAQVFRNTVARVVGEVQRPQAGMRLTGKADLSQVDDRRRKAGQDNYDPKTGRWSSD